MSLSFSYVASGRLLQRTAKRWLPGLTLVFILAVGAAALASTRYLQAMGVSALTLGIVAGLLLANLPVGRMVKRTLHGPIIDLQPGIALAKSHVLKVGVILYGFRFTYDQLAHIGLQGLIIDVAVMMTVFSTALVVGRYVFGLEINTVILIGAGSSICGAAAILATAPVIQARMHQIVVAIATVVIFGTVSMFLYPVLYHSLDMSQHRYGLYVGATVHEVAQVIAAASAISPQAADIAIMEKMLRVMLLAPFLLLLSYFSAGRSRQANRDQSPPIKAREGASYAANSFAKRRIQIPWFAIAFILIIGANSVWRLPERYYHALQLIDATMLTMAMVALGLSTQAAVLRQAGYKPMALGALLLAILTIGGYGLVEYTVV
ncbi:YeiH family protein [Salinimonas sediminis]|uniref:YeiH family protein n=1 Tax=Salinimonas sediminis TaxID=2303538 RepID=A0A346NPH8_9ALTE|nr:YeiH family protein [Salinimonas sediminis]AXR07435.1 YeiH family protein [Salinimonas sediminis]